MKKKMTAVVMAVQLAWAPVLLVPVTTGCALFSKTATVQEKAAEVQSLAYAAASIGTQVALEQNKDWRPQFEMAYGQLNRLVESKVISGFLLRNIIASLPVKELKSETARIVIEAATTLYDQRIGTKINIEDSPYVLAAATGIRDGMKTVLAK